MRVGVAVACSVAEKSALEHEAKRPATAKMAAARRNLVRVRTFGGLRWLHRCDGPGGISSVVARFWGTPELVYNSHQYTTGIPFE